MKYGLSIMNIGVITNKAIKVIAGKSGLFEEIKQPNKNKITMDKQMTN